MKGLDEFIVEIGKAFKDTIKHGSLELYTDYRTAQQEQSNRRGVIISTPMQVETDIEPGCEVLIDPTILFKQVYRGKMQESRFLVDEEKGWYRVDASMIIVYRNPGGNWKGCGENLLVKAVKAEEKETASGIILPKSQDEMDGYAEVVYPNEELLEQGVVPGDVIYFPKNKKWEFELEGQTYLYLRNKDILAKRE